MRTLQQIHDLLNQLEKRTADELEGQDIEFKEIRGSRSETLDMFVEMAVCMANGGGGDVIFGVHDKRIGRAQSITGVQLDLDLNVIKKNVYDRTDPKLTPHLQDLFVQEGTGRIIVMQILSGLPPYTDSKGSAKIRVGKACEPLTGSLRRSITLETGESDWTAVEINEPWRNLVSSSALQVVRTIAHAEKAPEDLLRLSDEDLLRSLSLLKNGHLTRAGLLIAGSREALKEKIPHHSWTFLKMSSSEVDYSNRIDDRNSIPEAVERLNEIIMNDNPLTTFRQGFFDFEYRKWPVIALREAIMNAFCHRDFRIPGGILTKQFGARLSISSPGGFIGGVSTSNILHHAPVSRNLLLVEALTQLRLVNRSNLGIERMYRSLLVEGKEPPVFCDNGDSVVVEFLASELSPKFKMFVASEEEKKRTLSVDELLILQYLLRHREIDLFQTARICQRSLESARDILGRMEVEGRMLNLRTSEQGLHWSLTPSTIAKIGDAAVLNIRLPQNRVAIKQKILEKLKRNAEQSPNEGMSNSEIRQLTGLQSAQVKKIMNEMQSDSRSIVQSKGSGRWTRYFVASRF